jgi:hypothetical protein
LEEILSLKLLKHDREFLQRKTFQVPPPNSMELVRRPAQMLKSLSTDNNVTIPAIKKIQDFWTQVQLLAKSGID